MDSPKKRLDNPLPGSDFDECLWFRPAETANVDNLHLQRADGLRGLNLCRYLTELLRIAKPR